MVWGVMFKSFIHVEFIFVGGVRQGSNFILLHVVIQFSQHHLLKILPFPHGVNEYSWLPHQMIVEFTSETLWSWISLLGGF